MKEYTNADIIKLFGFAVDAVQNYLHLQWFQNENRLWTRKDKTIQNKTLIEAFSIQSGADFGR